MATFNSSSSLELGDADLSVGSGQLGKAVFITLTANLAANSLPEAYDAYVLAAAAPFAFDLPTATQGYKVRLIASGAADVSIRSDAGVAFYTLRAGRSVMMQLIGTGPQVWHRYTADTTLNDAYKNGANGIINRDVTRQAVKVSSHPAPAVSDVLLAATYPGDLGLEARALEVGNTHVELLCEAAEGIANKSGRSVAIHSSVPSANSSIMMTMTSSADVTNSLVFGPFTANLTDPISNTIYVAPGGRANFATPVGSNARSVILAPGTTLTLDTGANPLLDQMLLGCGNTITIDDFIGGAIIGARNVFNAGTIQFPGFLCLGSTNTFTQAVGPDQVRYMLIGNSNTINTTTNGINAMLVGNGNNIQSLAGTQVVVGNFMNTLRIGINVVDGAIFGSLVTAEARIGDFSGAAFAIASTVDSFPQESIIAAASSVLRNRNAAAVNAINCSLSTSDCNVEEFTLLGCRHQVTVTATLAKSILLVGNRITVPQLAAGTNVAVSGIGVVCSSPNTYVTKAVETVDPLTVGGTGTRSRHVAISSSYRLSSAEPADTSATINTDADAAPATPLGFDSIFEQKNLFRPVTVAIAATQDFTLSSAIPTSSVMNLEFAFQTINTAASTSNTYRGRSRVHRQGGAAVVDAPILDSFVGILAPITVTLIVTANAPVLRFANTGVGATQIRISGSATFSVLSLV